jgi:hypothetical protein
MKKNLLLLSALFVSVLSFGQAFGTLSNVVYPTTATPGQALTITFTYTSTVATAYEFQILAKDLATPANTIYGTNYAYVNMALPATAIPVNVTANITVSPSAALSASLPNATISKYIWFGKLDYTAPTGDPDVYTGNPDMIISAPLSVNSFNINSDEMYVTSAKSLVVKGNVNAESAIIYDMTGRSVASVKNLRASNIDLSALRNGVYFLVDNNKRTFKFAL